MELGFLSIHRKRGDHKKKKARRKKMGSREIDKVGRHAFKIHKGGCKLERAGKRQEE